MLKDSGSNLTAEKTCSHQLWLSTRRKKKNTDDVAMILNMHAVTKQVFTEFLKLFITAALMYIMVLLNVQETSGRHILASHR